MNQRPYGSWTSPINSRLLTSAGIGLSEIWYHAGYVYWLESRPLEAGRVVVVRSSTTGAPSDAIPQGFNARTRVHEYGGGAYVVGGETIFFSNFKDQRLYRCKPGESPRPITPEPEPASSLRYADARVTPDGQTIVCVRERHVEAREAINEVVALPADGSSEPKIILSGYDFYSFPRITPDGQRLAWTCWNHPQMPWDGTELWAGELNTFGGVTKVHRIAGGSSESIFQPEWSPEGQLHFISDRSGWWNLYAEQSGKILALAPMDAEFGLPQWQFGYSRYAFLSGGRIACIYSHDGLDHLAVLDTQRGRMEKIDLPYTTFGNIDSDGGDRLFFIASSAARASEIVALNVGDRAVQVLRRAQETEIDQGYISAPESIEFPTSNGLTSHALYYAPRNKDFIAPAGERPPLLVISHGGPTSATTSSFKVGIQYWTSRGFAVVDVNYGGSTGYGREYRERLRGQWGVVDVEDCINAAKYLVNLGYVDGRRMTIRGGSAGGYTTLCALVFHKVFSAGASYYGVADIEALGKDTHKFEARYDEGLVPRGLYYERSPVHFADRFSCPVILFQGLEDKVVPPSQTEVLIAALRKNKIPFAYVAFPTEGHGFREAENIIRATEAELYFYSRVFGFETDVPVPQYTEHAD